MNKESNEISNDKARRPAPKQKEVFSLDNFKKKIGNDDVPDKPLEFIKLSEGFKKATGLPGFAKGYVNLARGHSNTGKSTAICEAIVEAQRMGDLPVIIDTENNIGKARLSLMGFDWNGPHLYIDNEYLLTQFGKVQDKNRNEAAIEDLAKFISFILDQQTDGNLPFDVTFFIDSIGTLNCIKTVNALEKDDVSNNMWNANSIEKSFMYILNSTIPNSRKQNKLYTNTIVAVQKIWIDNMNNGVVKHKGGETFYLGSRLIFHFGGIVTHGTKRVVATSKGRDISYGIETKINVAKNQIEGPLGGISMEGKIVSVPHGFIYPDDIPEYKKKNILYFRNLFEDDSIDVDELEMKSCDVDNNGKVMFTPNEDFE